MLTGRLWPAHPHPYRDELLSSWLVRLAHANGCKVQTFCHLIFDNNQEVWNRDIDRLAPEWLLKQLSRHTGVPPRMVQKTTLRKFEGLLYPEYRSSGHLNWIVPLQIYHRKRRGHSLQFCPICLENDIEPYFRTAWRLALYTFCPYHMVMMHDRCPACEAQVAFHRQELGRPNEFKPQPLNLGWNCQANLAESETIKAPSISDPSFKHWAACLKQYGNRYSPMSLMYSHEHMAILRHLCGLIANAKHSPRLQAYLCDRVHIPEIEFTQKRILIEQRSTHERHQAILLAWWVLSNWPDRLYKAWHYKAIRYNYLLKDLHDYPEAFKVFVSTLNRNVNKKLYKDQS